MIDVATLKPLDMSTILESVAETGRCVVIHEPARTGGFGGEITAGLAERGLPSLLAPVRRVSVYDFVVPLARLENQYLPSVKRNVSEARSALEFKRRERAFTAAKIFRACRVTNMKIFKLPDLGEGLQEARIVPWHVKVGGEVQVDQPLVSAELGPPEDLRGCTIMLCNFGIIAGKYVAPVVLPLSLTFDYRVVSGGEASRFLATVIGDLDLAA